jgi:hypothetical protein
MHRPDSSMKELNASPGESYPTASTEEEDYPAIAHLCLPCTSKYGAIQSGVTILSEKPQSSVRNLALHASPEIPSLQVQALSPGISQAQEEPALHEADSAAGKRDVSMMSPRNLQFYSN